MLSIIVSEAAHGVNIAQKYPVFFLRLLENRELLTEFLDSLELLHRTRTDTLEPLPGPPSRDLSFLTARPQPELSCVTINASNWNATLKLNAAQLDVLFFPSQPEPVTRHGLNIGLDEDNWFILFRETIEAGDGSWNVVLEGTPVYEPEGALKLAVSAVPIVKQENDQFCLQATLSWCSYGVTVTFDDRGWVSLPLLTLASVLEESGSGIKCDLLLSLACTRKREMPPST